MWLGAFTWMINASIATFVVRQHLQILRVTMRVVTLMYKQPENPDEETLCQEAMEGCPVEAIGSDAN